MQSAIKASLLGTLVSFGLSACASLSQPPAPVVNGNPSQPPAASTPTIQPNYPTPPSSPTVNTIPASKPEVTAYPVTSSPITITPIKTTTLPPPVVSPAPKPATTTPARVSPPIPDLPSTRDASTSNEDERPDTYTVKPGDNLFRIALNHGFGYRELAEMNQISNSDEIKVGQVLRLRDPAEKETTASADDKKPSTKEATATPHTTSESPSTAKPTKPVESLPRIASTTGSSTDNSSKTGSNQANGKSEKLEKPTENKVTTKPNSAPESKPSQKTDTKIDNNTEKSDKNNKNAETKTVDAGNTDSSSSWVWPTQGKLIQNFSEKTKGIDIAGKTGQPVYASSAGKVVYSGSGLRGYGKLIIIKHDKTFLSAYAHNSQLLIKEGQTVTKGQKIAEMGNTDADQTKLHFEIRRYGKPVDPTGYLGKP